MKISVIIPAYNAAKVIAFCLNSLVKQLINRSDWEIIVVDDGSTDGTCQQVNKFPEVKYFYQSNKGSAAARNLGIKNSTGEIILFIDADCQPTDNWVEEMVKPFSDSSVMSVKGAYLSKQKSLVARLTQIEFEERYAKMGKAEKIDFVDTYAAAFRRKALEHIGIFDEELMRSMDAELAFRVDKSGYKIVFNPMAKVYHLHPSTCKSYWRKKFWRAFWRMNVYNKYPKKIIKDSYTPQTLKLQILLIFSFLLTLLFWPFISFVKYLLYAEIAGFLLLSMPLTIRALKKGILEGLTMPFFLVGRSLALGLGIFQHFNVIKEFRSFLIFVLLAIILILPSFFGGGREEIAQFIVILAVLPLVILSIREKKQKDEDFWSWQKPFLPLLLLIIWMGLSSIYSLVWAASLHSFFSWITYFLIGWATFNLIKNRKRALQFSYLVIGLGFVLGIIGLYFFALTEHYNYLRLFSTFYYHNPFGGFLLMIIPLGLVLYLKQKNKKIIYLLFVINSVLLTSLVLTHSRGSWVSIIIPIIFLLIVLGKRIKRKGWTRLAMLTIAVVILSLGLNFLKVQQAAVVEKTASYSLETSGGNALEARFSFFESALSIYKSQPVLGAGHNAFQSVLPQYQDDVRYYSTDPHNIVLKTMSELGTIGLLLFLWFSLAILYLICEVVKDLNKSRPTDFLLLGICLGLIGAMTHNLMDFDWQFPTNIILFIIWVAVLARLYSKERKNKVIGEKLKIFRNILLIFIVIFLAFYGTVQLLADNHYQQYQSLAEDNNWPEAEIELDQAINFNPYSFNYLYQQAVIDFQKAENMDDYQMVEKKLNQVVSLHQCHAPSYDILAKIALAREDKKTATDYFFQAIDCRPLEPDYYYNLAVITYSEEQYQAVIDLADKIINKYPLRVFSSSIWINPNKPRIKNSLSELSTITAVSYSQLGKLDQAEELLNKALQYNPDNQSAQKIRKDLGI